MVDPDQAVGVALLLVVLGVTVIVLLEQLPVLHLAASGAVPTPTALALAPTHPHPMLAQECSSLRRHYRAVQHNSLLLAPHGAI